MPLIANPVTQGHTEVTSLKWEDATELTIASGAITITQSLHTIDTESDGGTDDLDSIAGVSKDGYLLVIRPASGSRSVVLKHAIGANLICCPGASDITMADTNDLVGLVYNGTQWVVAWVNLLTGPLIGSAYLPLAGGTMSGTLKLNDSVNLVLGTGNDDTLVHDGTNSSWTHTTGTLTIDNTATAFTLFDGGNDASTTGVKIRNNSGGSVLEALSDGTFQVPGVNVSAGGATAGTPAILIESGDRTKNDADAGVPTSGALTIRSGTTSQITTAATGGASGAVSLRSGATDVTVAAGTGGASGALTLRSGDTDISAAVAATGGASGAWSGGSGAALSTGATATSGASGAVTLSSGTSADANTGTVTLESGVPAATGTSGNVVIQSGNPTGAGISGDIVLTTGATSGGTQGILDINAATIDTTTQDTQFLIRDAQAAALQIGSSGDLAMMTFDTSEGSEVVVIGAALGLRLNDNSELRFGTPGTDVVMTPDGTDLVISATGDVVFADSVDLMIGTGKDTGIKHDGTNTTIDHNTGELIFAIGTRAVTHDPEIGGELKMKCVDSGITALDTGGATTVITLSIPTGARLHAIAANVTTAVAGVSASGVTMNLAFTGGSSLSMGDFVNAGDGNVAQNTKITKILDPNQAGLITTNTTEAAVVFSGGVDNTPSGGAVRVAVWYETISALDNA